VRVLIVDDEAPARARLRRLLASHGEVEVVGEAGDGAEALEMAARLAPEVLFLDVQMPEASGLDVAASLPDDGPMVVFVTAHDRYALQAFDARAVDYLLKPVEPERLARALQRLQAQRPGRRTSAPAATQLLIADRGRTHVVRCAEIEHLEAADNYVAVHVPGRSLLMRRTLAGLLADLGDGFVRCHRGAAVAIARVQEVRPRDKGDATLVMRSGAEVPCSRQHRAEVLRRLQG
jgi:two-component system LytT family response regulator